MNCPKCNSSKVEVLESRDVPAVMDSRKAISQISCTYNTTDSILRRRRSCKSCKHRWTTYELSMDDLNKIKGVPPSHIDLIKTNYKSMITLLEA